MTPRGQRLVTCSTCGRRVLLERCYVLRRPGVATVYLCAGRPCSANLPASPPEGFEVLSGAAVAVEQPAQLELGLDGREVDAARRDGPAAAQGAPGVEDVVAPGVALAIDPGAFD